jgi:hypothetical protein
MLVGWDNRLFSRENTHYAARRTMAVLKSQADIQTTTNDIIVAVASSVIILGAHVAESIGEVLFLLLWVGA